MFAINGLGIPIDEINRSINGLGEIPNDFEASRDLCYMPVRQGWIYGYTRPTAGALAGLGQSEAALEELNRSQRRLLTLQTVSTVAITVIAATALFGCLRGR